MAELGHLLIGKTMPTTHDQPAKGTDTGPVIRLGGNPDTDPVAARQLHTSAIAGGVYGRALRRRIAGVFDGMNLDQSAMVYIDDLIERMAPRDPLEEMLVVQALMAHARVLHLTDYANQQDRLEAVRIANEYADRASNTYRRLMLALAEYRKPPRTGDSFTAIRQANIAGQQVVTNGETPPSTNATNEQGCSPADQTPHEPHEPHQSRTPPPVLHAEPAGSGFPASVGPAREALGAVHRAKDATGQGP